VPIYEYQCDDCADRFEVRQSMKDDPLTTCPRCGKHVQRLISSPAIMFKGSGWYVTDYSGKHPVEHDFKHLKHSDNRTVVFHHQEDSGATGALTRGCGFGRGFLLGLSLLPNLCGWLHSAGLRRCDFRRLRQPFLCCSQTILQTIDHGRLIAICPGEFIHLRLQIVFHLRKGGELIL